MTTEKIIPWTSQASDLEKAQYDKLQEYFETSPIPEKEKLANLGLFMNRSSVSRLLFMHELYQKIINTHGVIMEFGTRWGQNLALFSTFRHMYEPYNMSRKIVGFDTFSGFPSVSEQDGDTDLNQIGALNVSENYEQRLDEILTTHQNLAPRPNMQKYELVKGDVCETLPAYLKNHQETIIALAYFDLDLYEPTLKGLEAIKPYLAKNSIVAFDELALREFPGETQALREAWGTSNFRIIRTPTSVQQSYVIFE